MKALSLSRPWPWAFLRLGKPLENRKRKDGRMPYICRHRGPLLLHAAQSWDKTAIDWMLERGLIGRIDWAYQGQPEHHQAGGIFARCRVVGAIEPIGSQPSSPLLFTDDPLEEAIDYRWWMGGHALIFADVEPTPFVECRGHLGLWNVPDDVLEQLEKANG